MLLIFCDNGFNSKKVEKFYEKEYNAAIKLGLKTVLFSFDDFKLSDYKQAFRNIPKFDEPINAIYRGWMMKPDEYQQFYKHLSQKNIQLINTPDEYKFCHYLPENYETIKTVTPLTTFKKLNGIFDIKEFKNQLIPFGSKPIIVKDYVKSQKHQWKEACYIPDASDLKAVNRIVKNFLQLQGTDLNEGLVFREFSHLKPLTNHTKSGMPLTKEFRLFILNGQVISALNYWEEGNYQDDKPPTSIFKEIIPKIKSKFFSMDIAQTINGEWKIIELGDGQVAGLPEDADYINFVLHLKNIQNL